MAVLFVVCGIQNDFLGLTKKCEACIIRNMLIVTQILHLTFLADAFKQLTFCLSINSGPVSLGATCLGAQPWQPEFKLAC